MMSTVAALLVLVLLPACLHAEPANGVWDHWNDHHNHHQHDYHNHAWAAGDPLLTGFDGHTFDFPGKANQTFNIITEKEHQLNAAFIAANLKDHFENGTLVGSVGMAFNNIRVEVSVADDGSLTVIANGVRMTPAWTSSFADQSATLNFDEYGYAVTLTTPLFIWTMFGIGPEMKAVINCTDPCTDLEFVRSHIDIQAELTAEPRALHGALGQTINNEVGVLSPWDMAFHGEGEEADYRVSGLFDTDFKFNLFGSTPVYMARALLAKTAAVTGYSKVPATHKYPLIAHVRGINN